jgi:protein TonB
MNKTGKLFPTLLAYGLCLTSGTAWAQVKAAHKPVKLPAAPCYGVEQMPTFKGGDKELAQVLAANLRWPTCCPLVQGKVLVGFVITAEGRVKNAKVLKGVHPAADAEALRVINLLDGNWIPGRQNNQPVDVNHILPITFRLN